MEETLQTLQSILDQGRRIVFFTGAGASTESGIPDFRSVDGLYRQQYDYPPEEIISHHFFKANPKEFYRFYRSRMLYPNARPNAAHRLMAELEKTGRYLGVVTQNIDNLHTLAGSQNVAELHGSIMRNYCVHCHHEEGLDFILNTKDLPRCPICGGLMKPDVVLYEEALDESVMDKALTWIRQADVLIICGTSLAVYPAAGMVRYFTGDQLVVINKTATPMDDNADLCIQAPLAETLGQMHVESTNHS